MSIIHMKDNLSDFEEFSLFVMTSYVCSFQSEMGTVWCFQNL